MCDRCKFSEKTAENGNKVEPNPWQDNLPISAQCVPEIAAKREGDSWKAKYYRKQDIILKEIRQDGRWIEVALQPPNGKGLFSGDDIHEAGKHCQWIVDNVCRKDSITEQEYHDAVAHTEAIAALFDKHKEV